jgi:hypothetical protein
MALLLALVLTDVAHPESPTIEGIPFSQADAKVLAELKRKEEAAKMLRSVLAIAPFMQIIDAVKSGRYEAVADMAVTVKSLDFALTAKALSAVDKIKVCKLAETVQYHLYTTDPGPEGKARQFFEELEKIYSSQCKT